MTLQMCINQYNSTQYYDKEVAFLSSKPISSQRLAHLILSASW